MKQGLLENFFLIRLVSSLISVLVACFSGLLSLFVSTISIYAEVELTVIKISDGTTVTLNELIASIKNARKLGNKISFTLDTCYVTIAGTDLHDVADTLKLIATEVSHCQNG